MFILIMPFEVISAEEEMTFINRIDEEYCLLVSDDEWERTESISSENEYKYKDIVILEYENEKEYEEAYEALTSTGIEVEKNDIFELAETDLSYIREKAENKANSDYKNVPVIDTGIKIAVIDTGYDMATYGMNRIVNPTDLKGNSSAQDLNGHGTAVSRLILENTSEGIYVMPVKITDSNGRCSVLDMYMAINYCIEQKVDIINISMTAYRPDDGTLIESAIREAVKNGIAVIVAAGNGGGDVADYSPGNCDEAITVSACDSNYNLCSFSNFGSTVDFCAYGELEGSMSGTSFSAAQVTTAFAELKVMNDKLSIAQYEQLLRDAAIKKGQPDKNSEFGYGIITIEGLNALFESRPCEASPLLNGNCLTMDDESFNNLIRSTPYSTIRRFLIDLTEDERQKLLNRETYLSNSKTNFVVIENVTEDENSAQITRYSSLYDYLMKNEFETVWRCSDSTKTGYYYLSYRDIPNNTEVVQKIRVKLTGLPTAEGNKQGKITLIDDESPADESVGYTIEKVAVTSGLETNYIYIAAKARLKLGNVNHYSLKAGKDSSTYDVSMGGGGITNIMDKSSIACTGTNTDIKYVNMQVSFYNIGISVTGGKKDTGKHLKLIVTGRKNDSECTYSEYHGIENGIREVKCKACKAAAITEYLHTVLMKFQQSDGTYPDDQSEEYVQKLNMDGTDFEEQYDGNYYAPGMQTRELLKTFDNTVYKDAVLTSVSTTENVEEHILLVPRKNYVVIFDGNQNTDCSMDDEIFYFDQVKELPVNQFVRKYKLTLYSNGGKFNDGTETREIEVDFKFKCWNTREDGSGTSIADKQEVSNLILSESNDRIETVPDGETVTLYAQWETEYANFPEDIKKIGHELIGWSKTEEGENSFTEFVPYEDTALYAIWIPAVYKIRLISGDEVTKDKRGTEEFYEKYADNYYHDPSGEKVFDTRIIIPSKKTKDVISINKANDKSYDGKVISTTATNIEIERNWQFDGYYTALADGNDLVVDKNGNLIKNINNSGDYKYFTKDTSADAKWKKMYCIVYQSNLSPNDLLDDSEIELPSMGESMEGEQITLKTSVPKVKNDLLEGVYSFKGWSTDAYGNNMVLDSKDRLTWTTKVTKDIVLYAIWDTGLEIKYNGNNQTSGENYTQKASIYDSIELIDNTAEYFGANSIDMKYLLSKSDETTVINPSTGDMNVVEEVVYVFKGWSTKEDAKAWDDTVLKPGATYEIQDLLREGKLDKNDRTLDLFAVWDAKPIINATDEWIDIGMLEKLDEAYIIEHFNINVMDREEISDENTEGKLKNADYVNVISFQKDMALYYAESGDDFSVQIVYQAKDRAGNTSRKPVMIHLVNTRGKKLFANSDVRFISGKYLNTLMDNSIWNSEDYRHTINGAIDKTKDKNRNYEFVFSIEDIKEVKEYILNNQQDRKTKEKLTEFYERFCVGKQ